MTPEERDELVDMIAQAVIDRIEERDRINRIAEMVVERVMVLQEEIAQEQNGPADPEAQPLPAR